jgi:hypothetical protein
MWQDGMDDQLEGITKRFDENSRSQLKLNSRLLDMS